MPGARHPDKVGASLWMHKDIFEAMGIAAKLNGCSVTHFILEALSEKMGFTLDAADGPVGLDLETITRKAFENRKRPARSKKAKTPQ